MQEYITDYVINEPATPDIIIREEKYQTTEYPKCTEKLIPYMSSGDQFYGNFLKYHGFMLHASCIVINGGAYLFSGECGVGKSTHTHLLKKWYGGEIINDDKPAIRKVDDAWVAYGTPWSGKDHENQNTKSPVKAICFLTKDRSKNELRPLSTFVGATGILQNTLYHLRGGAMEVLLQYIDDFTAAVPCYSLDSLANQDTAKLLFDEMVNHEV